MKKFNWKAGCDAKLRFLGETELERVHQTALNILENAGVFFDDAEALNILTAAGCAVDRERKIARIPKDLAESSLKLVPDSFPLWDREGESALKIGGDISWGVPGSASLDFLESDGATCRAATSADLVNISRVTDALRYMPIQATALAVSDAPQDIADAWRVSLLLKTSPKPILSGAFNPAGVARIHALLTAARGDADDLKEKPMILMDVCSSPPLKWSEISCRNLIDCARLGLPIELISVPMPGAATPATMAGSIAVSVAESISGIVLAQSVAPGCLMVMGGAPMAFDMRHGTTSLNAPETSLIAVSCAQLARAYGVPSHTYAGCADAKLPDAQAGIEAASSLNLALLGGVNVIAGAGLLEFAGSFSLEALLLDHEAFAMAARNARGVQVTDDTLAQELICRLGPGADYLREKHTRSWYRREAYVPSRVLDRRNRPAWEQDGRKSAFAMAQEEVTRLLAEHTPKPIEPKACAAIDKVMEQIRKDAE